jgi:hypothetical protein
VIQISNHGPLITATNYWDSELAREGKLFVSVNAGAIRVLLPPQLYVALNDMRAVRECVLSRGPWSTHLTPEQALSMDLPRSVETAVLEGIEIMWDDGSDAPYALHLTPASFDLLPAEPEPGREWLLSVWVAKDGSPHKSLERKCHWRRVDQIPSLAPWGVLPATPAKTSLTAPPSSVIPFHARETTPRSHKPKVASGE